MRFIMRLQIFSLLLSATVFTTNPLFAMDPPEDKEPTSILRSSASGPLFSDSNTPYEVPFSTLQSLRKHHPTGAVKSKDKDMTFSSIFQEGEIERELCRE